MSEPIIEKIRKQFVIVKSLILNEQGKILFVKRKKEDLKQAHNKWEFPGGKVDFGETPEQTAVREAKEESGYDISVDFLLPKILSSKWIMPERESQQILICYACKLSGGEMNLNDHGVSEIKWFDINNVPENENCLPGTIDFINIYKDAVKKNGEGFTQNVIK
jgi:8-oxo-dGTP diphosphatase